MSNLTKTDAKRVALHIDGGRVDELSCQRALIAVGLSADDAIVVSEKMANICSSALSANEYRLKLIDIGIGADQAKQLAENAASFLMSLGSDQGAVPGRVDGIQSFNDVIGLKKAISALKKSTKEPAPSRKATNSSVILTVQQSKLLDVGEKIANTKVDEYGEFMSFTHSVLCQVGLPRAKIEAREFMRRSGDAWVNVQSGWLDEGKGPVQQPIPYGAMPRLALAWVSSYAKRYNTREIPIGESAAEFLRLMGMESQGARYTTLRKQMHALAACRLQLGFKGRTFNGQPVEQFDAWLSNAHAAQRSLWPGVMTLSDVYFTSLMESAVPLDNRALHALKGSALALDVYAWLAHRLHRIEGRPVILHWKSIREQFAQEYEGKDPDKDFKKKFLPVLRNVQVVYPQARVKQVNGGLMLMGSPPPIPKKT